MILHEQNVVRPGLLPTPIIKRERCNPPADARFGKMPPEIHIGNAATVRRRTSKHPILKSCFARGNEVEVHGLLIQGDRRFVFFEFFRKLCRKIWSLADKIMSLSYIAHGKKHVLSFEINKLIAMGYHGRADIF